MIIVYSSSRQALKPRIFLILFFSSVFYAGCRPDKTAERRTWEIYKGDEVSSSYSGLRQINTKNVDQLQIAWTFYPKDAPKDLKYFGKAECNPIIVNGIMYLTSGQHQVYALNATNGKKIWTYDPYEEDEGGRGANRGVTYWADGENKRILFTAGDHLFALNAENGNPISSFGTNGKVSLNEGLDVDPSSISVRASSPGMIYKNLLILGSQLSEQYGTAPGYIRAYNVQTGKLVWTFHTIPQPGEPGYETWPKDAWKYTGGVNNWTGMSLDRKRGWVFLPLGSPTYDLYAGNRLGQNLYGNCLLVLDAQTGKHVWHFQTVHHDLWDYDLPAPPNLVTVERKGKEVDAVAQLTKTGFLFLLNRENGKPLFPIEERKVPASNMPGEEAWPTQPFPQKPEPYARQKVSPDDVTDRTPEARAAVLKQLDQLRSEGLFTPPDSAGTVEIPGTRGGAEWGGGAYDPETGILYFNANNWPEIITLRLKNNAEKRSSYKTIYEHGKALYMNNCSSCHGENMKGEEGYIPSLVKLKSRISKKEVLNRIEKGAGRMPAFSNILSEEEEEHILAFLFGERKDQPLLSPIEKQTERTQKIDTTSRYTNITAFKHFEDPDGYPAIKPPWGTINAINLNTGEYVWQKPLGNISELQQEGAPSTGIQSWGGPIVTGGGLVITGGAKDKMVCVFDKANGSLLWQKNLPGAAYAIPATYMSKGKQYIVVTVSGTPDEPGGAIMAFALSN